MITTFPSSPSLCSYQNNGLSNADLQLATRMKEGRCTPEDEARIKTLVTSQESNTFFDDRTVQRILLQGVLDGKITDQGVLDRLKDCAVSLTEDDQIELIGNRVGVIRSFSFGSTSNQELVSRFFSADQQSTLFSKNTDLELVNAKQEDEAIVVNSDMDFLLIQSVVPFEQVANGVDGTVMAFLHMCDTSFPQGAVLNHDQLARAIIVGTANQIERQQFETMLASDNARTTFFNDSAVQVMIVKALCEGGEIDPCMLHGLRDCTPNLPVDNQRQLATAIKNGKFGTGSAVLLAVAQNLTIFTDIEAQRNIAIAISHSRFGINPGVSQVIVQNLRTFTNQEAQPTIELGICNSILETELAVLLAVAQNLTIFTDPEAQKKISWAIWNGEFGAESVVLQAVAQNLAIFTDTDAQRDIAMAIKDGKFRADPVVLQAVAQNLAIFTDPDAQRDIAILISDGKFGTVPAVLLAVAQNLTIFRNSGVQPQISFAIFNGVFGINPAVLLAVAQKLAIFTAPIAQQYIASAIGDGKFGADTAVLQTVAQNLTIFRNPKALEMIMDAIWDGKFGTDSAVFKAILKAVPQLLCSHTIHTRFLYFRLAANEKIEMLCERKFSLDVLATALRIPDEDWPKLFGAKAYLGSDIKTLLPTHFPDATADGIDSVCEDNVEYAIQIHHQRLILYPLGSHQDKIDFIGWMHPENGVSYKQCVTNIKIYDFGQLQSGCPTLLAIGNDLSPGHTLFATLPAYLQQAIRDNSFDIN